MLGDYIVSRPYIYRITTYMGFAGNNSGSHEEFREMARVHIESLVPIPSD